MILTLESRLRLQLGFARLQALDGGKSKTGHGASDRRGCSFDVRAIRVIPFIASFIQHTSQKKTWDPITLRLFLHATNKCKKSHSLATVWPTITAQQRQDCPWARLSNYETLDHLLLAEMTTEGMQPKHPGKV